MPGPDETFIVRVRHQERDAVLEQPRLSRRRQVGDVAEVGGLILRWLGPIGAEQTVPLKGEAGARGGTE
jgi:hypothetical protein